MCVTDNEQNLHIPEELSTDYYSSPPIELVVYHCFSLVLLVKHMAQLLLNISLH